MFDGLTVLFVVSRLVNCVPMVHRILFHRVTRSHSRYARSAFQHVPVRLSTYDGSLAVRPRGNCVFKWMVGRRMCCRRDTKARGLQKLWLCGMLTKSAALQLVSECQRRRHRTHRMYRHAVDDSLSLNPCGVFGCVGQLAEECPSEVRCRNLPLCMSLHFSVLLPCH